MNATLGITSLMKLVLFSVSGGRVVCYITHTDKFIATWIQVENGEPRFHPP